MDNKPRTTLGVRKTTRDQLDRNRAPGQCYDGFICQLVDLWERVKGKKEYYMTGSAGGNQGAEALDSRKLNCKTSPSRARSPGGNRV